MARAHDSGESLWLRHGRIAKFGDTMELLRLGPEDCRNGGVSGFELAHTMRRRAIKLLGFALGIAGLLASPAYAAVLSQTLSYSTVTSSAAASPWTNVFSFAAFKAPTPTSRLTDVRLVVSGEQDTKNGRVDCVNGAGGRGLGNKFCDVAGYQQSATFSLLSPPFLANAVSDLTVQQTHSYSGGLMVREDNAHVPHSNAQSIGSATTTSSFTYYNTLVSSGGTLDPKSFAGPGPINLTYQITPFSTVDLNGGGSAGLGFDSITYSLTLSLSYDYVDTHEPASLALFGVAAAGLFVVRRRARAV